MVQHVYQSVQAILISFKMLTIFVHQGNILYLSMIPPKCYIRTTLTTLPLTLLTLSLIIIIILSYISPNLLIRIFPIIKTNDHKCEEKGEKPDFVKEPSLYFYAILSLILMGIDWYFVVTECWHEWVKFFNS